MVALPMLRGLKNIRRKPLQRNNCQTSSKSQERNKSGKSKGSLTESIKTDPPRYMMVKLSKPQDKREKSRNTKRKASSHLRENPYSHVRLLRRQLTGRETMGRKIPRPQRKQLPVQDTMPRASELTWWRRKRLRGPLPHRNTSVISRTLTKRSGRQVGDHSASSSHNHGKSHTEEARREELLTSPLPSYKEQVWRAASCIVEGERAESQC